MKELDPRLTDLVFYAPESDSGGLPNPASEAKKSQDILAIIRDKRGRIVWKVKGNTPEQNEQLGIKNVQALFSEKFPEFNELYPRGEDGKINEEKSEEAEKFILDRIGTRYKFKVMCGSLVSRSVTPYFKGSVVVVIEKSFKPLGLFSKNIDSETNRSQATPVAHRDIRGKIKWNLPGNTREQNEHIGAMNIQAIFLEKFPDFNVLFPRKEDGKIAEDNRENAKRFILDKIETADKIQKIFGCSPINKKYVQYFEGSTYVLLAKSFSYWGIEFEWRDSSEGWMNNNALAKQLKKSFKTIKLIAEKYRQNHPEWFSTFTDSRKRSFNYYAPKLVIAIIDDTNKHTLPPNGWMNNTPLAKQLKRDPHTIKRIAKEYSDNHPEWFRRFLDPSGKPNEYYSPELINEITIKAKEYISPAEGWMNNQTLAIYVGMSRPIVKKYVESYRFSHPEWFTIFMSRSNNPIEFYSPLLIQEIKRVMERYSESKITIQKEPISRQEAKEEFDKLFENP